MGQLIGKSLSILACFEFLKLDCPLRAYEVVCVRALVWDCVCVCMCVSLECAWLTVRSFGYCPEKWIIAKG